MEPVPTKLLSVTPPRLKLRLHDRRHADLALPFPPAVDAEAQRLCRRVHGLVPGNQVTLLRDADEAYPAMLAAIRGAQRLIRLESYIFEDGEAGTRFGAALEERARAGVEVQVIYDAVGSIGTGAGFWERLRAAGAQVVEFHPLSLWRRLWRWNRRDHRKLLIVDDAVAFTGGLNISDAYLTTEVHQGWRDTHVRVEGPVVFELDRLFAASWQYVTERYLPPAPAAPAIAGPQAVAAIGSRLRRHRTEIFRGYLHAIKQARRTVRIANAYFIPPRAVRRALVAAVARGVRVEIIVPAWGDLMSAHFASRNLFDRLLAAGVRIHLWPDAVMHAKTAVIDGLWSTVGSFNLDHRSIVHNIELNLNVVDAAFGAEMDAMFDADRARCQEVVLFEWRLRALGERFLERLFYLGRYWL
ncbi:MAG TPA: phospholipase D-like domain-containing protein [Polyangia bacterium]|jgi:cardiolipin synthase